MLGLGCILSKSVFHRAPCGGLKKRRDGDDDDDDDSFLSLLVPVSIDFIQATRRGRRQTNTNVSNLNGILAKIFWTEMRMVDGLPKTLQFYQNISKFHTVRF